MSKEKYDYSTIETFGQLMLSLPDDYLGNEELTGDVPSDELLAELFRVAKDFEDEWRKVDEGDHEDVGDDYFDEVQKLADWVKEHLYDVLHNNLEYGGYKARRRVWGVVAHGEPPCSWWANFDNAVSDMLCQAGRFTLEKRKQLGGMPNYGVSASVIEGEAKASVSFYTDNPFDDNDYEFEVVSKLEEL